MQLPNSAAPPPSPKLNFCFVVAMKSSITARCRRRRSTKFRGLGIGRGADHPLHLPAGRPAASSAQVRGSAPSRMKSRVLLCTFVIHLNDLTEWEGLA